MNLRPTLLASCAVALHLLSISAIAEIRLPHLLGDHAVLQRERPIHIWGWATPDASLTAHFHEQTIAAIVNQFGQWSLWLSPEHAGGPYVLSISGDGAPKQLSDLLVGDVWFASGQSNMEMPLAGFPPTASVKNAAAEIAAANNPQLRLLLVDHKSSDVPLDDLSGAWAACTPETASRFSAVAYFFGREIAAREHVPIGLIDSSWGGTPADSWVSLDTLGRDPALLPAFHSRAHFAASQSYVPAQIAAERHEDADAKAAGKPAPRHDWHPDQSSWSPAGLYNAMVAPAVPYSLRGFLWYQGETNSAPDRAPFYSTLFPALIADWRMHFAGGTLPFLFVQISSFNSPGENWGLVRDAQRRTLSMANTAMAVTLDVGTPDNVHPPDKQTVGGRLALAARSMVYGENIPYASPLFREVTSELGSGKSTSMRVWFDHADGLTTRGKPLEGFELAGDDHHFVPAVARQDGETVVVSSASLPNPRYVRYAWAGVAPASLYNAAGLPASTFTSEDEPPR